MRSLDLPRELDLVASWRPLVASSQDPTIRVRPRRAVRASRTPDGPGTLRVELTGPGRAEVEAWGPGAAWLLDRAAPLLGAEDDLDGFVPSRHPTVERAARRQPGLRMIRTGCVADVLVPVILAQRVTAVEAARSWTRLVRRFGEPAPGPYDLLLPPSAQRLASTPDWALRPLGVDRARARTISAACRAGERLQATLDLPPGQRAPRFLDVPGLGPWTTALVLRAAAGDPDQVEVGDFHVKHQVSWSLAGEPRGSDERMLELLEPFAGHRGRVVRLLVGDASRPPAFGPRQRVVAVETL